MSNEPKIKRKYGESEVTITFKGNNPNIKEDVMNMLCDSFEERVVTGSEPEQIKYVETEIKTTESKPKSEKEAAPKPIINPAPVPAAQKRRRSHAR